LAVPRFAESAAVDWLDADGGIRPGAPAFNTFGWEKHHHFVAMLLLANTQFRPTSHMRQLIGSSGPSFAAYRSMR
jgi:hypothetical protein